MTVTVPKWLLVAGGVLLVAVIAFLLGRSLASDGGSTELASGGGGGLECDKQLGLTGVERFVRVRGEDGAALLDEQTGKLGDFYSEVIKCSDLNGDGLDEMVLLVDGVGAGGARPISWFILEQGSGQWNGVFRRTVPSPQIEVKGEVIRESTPGYLEDAPFGFPSYRRIGTVVSKGDSYEYLPTGQDSLGRKLILSPETDTVTRIGSLDVMTLDPASAKTAFGRPSIFFGSGESCPTTWSDLGLTINFVNLGGLDACKEGLVGSFELLGSAAETAGWIGPRGVRVGMTFNEVAERFPSTTRSEYPASDLPLGWEAWTLLSGATVFSDSVPTITGNFDGKTLRELVFYVGAGGE